MVICPGMSVTLDAGDAYSSYAWSDGSPGQTLTVASAGSYSVAVTDIAGTVSMDTIDVIMQPAVSSNFASSNVGPNFSFTNTSNNAVAFVWTFGDGTMSTNPSPSHTFSSPGTYTVCLEAISDCESKTTCQTMSFKKGWDDADNDDIDIQPAATGDASIIVTMTNGQDIDEIDLLDWNGNNVRHYDGHQFSSNGNIMPASGLIGGFYILAVNTEGGLITRKVCIRK